MTPPGDPEGEIDLVARAQMAGHDLWVPDLTFFNNDRADRADHRRRLGFLFACAQCQKREGHWDGKASEAEQWGTNGIQNFHERLQVSVVWMRISAKSKKPQFWSVQETRRVAGTQRVAGEARKR